MSDSLTSSPAPTPPLLGIDHVHVDVRDRSAAAAWYARVLGLNPVAALAHWVADHGPLVVADGAGQVHLALFERAPSPAAGRSTVALGCGAAQWARWRAHLAAQLSVQAVFQDHGESWSLYFSDPDGNPYELTCTDVDGLRAAGLQPG